MKIHTLVLCFAIAAGLAFTFTYASVVIPARPYSVNVHLIPPLVRGECTLLTFWSPPNITCATCFCFFPQISRCVPRAGCNPNNATMNGTTTTPGPSTVPGVTPTTIITSINDTTTAPSTTAVSSTDATPDSTPSTAPTPGARKSRSPRFGASVEENYYGAD